MKYKIILLFIFLAQLGQAQRRSKDNKGLALLVNMNAMVQKPGGNMKDRYGNNNAFGLGLELMTDKGNWIFGGEFNYLAGKKVKENPITSLYNVEDKIYGGDFQATNIFLRERGYWLGGYIGKLIPISAYNQRSGIRVTVGVGHIQHKIRIQDDTKTVVQLEKPYVYGYDRLTGGLYLSEFVGYQVLSKNRLINFTIGFDFMQGFTKSMRDWDWDKKSKDITARKDLLSGLRVNWTLPFYIGEKSEEIFY